MNSGPFHEIGSMFPDEITLVPVPPDTSVVDALQLMLEKRFSQLPVMDGRRLLGVFSQWGLTGYLAAWPDATITDLKVLDVMDPRFPAVTVRDPLESVLELLDRHDAALVTSPHGVQAVVTAADVLRYFYGVARPFVLLQEIEMGLRNVIASHLDAGQLAGLIEVALRGKYSAMGRPLPRVLDDLTFEDYRSLLGSKDNWTHFMPIFGGTRALTSARLDRVRGIRNKVFHFRGEVTVVDYQALVVTRDWLLQLSTAEPGTAGGGRP